MNRIPDDQADGGAEKALTPATRLVTGGRDPFAQHGFVNTPIYRGSTVLYRNAEDFLQRKAKFTYGTKGTPTTNSLEVAWTDLTGAAGTVLVPSGLAAISIALLCCLKSGDHLLVPNSVYRPTRNFCDSVLRRFGVETTYYDPLLAAEIAREFKPNTRAVFTEAPGSLSFEMQDIPAIAGVAHAHDAIVLMDNTWATPLFFNSHAKGVDIAIDAGTKYLSGASDLLLGLVSANERCWKDLRATFDTMAICAGPEDVFLALRGLRSMRVRLLHQQESGLAVARWLGGRPEVARVLHPALEIGSGSRAVETRFHRCVLAVQHHPQTDARGCGARLHQCADLVRHRRVVGRLREPGDPVRLQAVPYHHDMGAGRPRDPLPHRAGRCRRPDRRP